MNKKSIQLLIILLLGGFLMACSQYPEEDVQYEQYLSQDNPVVTIEIKNHGTIQVELFYDVAPNTVNNFIHHVNNGYYDGLIFHRVIEGFMIQGGWGEPVPCAIAGDFLANGVANPLKHTRGVISMARTMDPNSATTQFFIMHNDYPSLDGNYAAFGGVIKGFNVIDKIATTTTGMQDRPVSDIVITKMTVDTKGLTITPPVCFE